MHPLASSSQVPVIRAATVSFQLRPAGSPVRSRQPVWTKDLCPPEATPVENRSRSNQTRPQAVPSTPAILGTASVREDSAAFLLLAISKVRDVPVDKR